DLLLVAVGLRRRGPDRHCPPPPQPPGRRRPAGDAAEAGLRRRRALRRRARAARLRRAAIWRVGLDQAEAGRPGLVGAVTDDLARTGRLRSALALSAVGDLAPGARQGAARSAGDAEEQAADRRPDDVLLPVPGTGRAVLRRAALPLGRTRALGARHRREADTALADAAGGSDRDPPPPAPGEPAPGRPDRPADAPPRDGDPARCARHRFRSRDRAPADAADRLRHRRT